jgi:hypothetical protein
MPAAAPAGTCPACAFHLRCIFPLSTSVNSDLLNLETCNLAHLVLIVSLLHPLRELHRAKSPCAFNVPPRLHDVVAPWVAVSEAHRAEVLVAMDNSNLTNHGNRIDYDGLVGLLLQLGGGVHWLTSSSEFVRALFIDSLDEI